MLCSFALVSARGMYFDRSDVKNVITGTAAFTDYKNENPGVFRKITVADLPQPFATQGVSNSPSLLLNRPMPGRRLRPDSKSSSMPVA